MINVKEHLKLTGIYTFFAAFPAILQLVVYPIIEGNDRLGAEDFGYLAITEAVISFLVMFCLYGMAITIARFYYDYTDNPGGYKKLVSTIISGVIGRGAILLIPIILFSDFWGSFFSHPALQNFDNYGYLLAIIAFNRSVIAVALSLYRSEKNVQKFVIISLISGLFRTIMQIVGVLYFDMSFVGYLAGTAIGGGIASLSVIVYSYSRCGITFSGQIMKSLRSFASSLFVTDLLFWGIMFFDRFLLLKNPAQLGIYDNALKFAMGVQFIVQGLAASVQPELFYLFKKGVDRTENDIKTLSNIFIAESIAVVGITSIPIMLFINYFYETSLILSANIITLVLVKYILNAQYQVFLWPILFMKESKKYFILNLSIFVIIIILNLLLTPKYGYMGAISSFIFAGIIQVLIFYYYQKKVISIQWNIVKVLFFPLLIVIIAFAFELLKLKYNLNLYLTSSILVLIIFFGLLLLYRKDIFDLIQKLQNKMKF